MDVRGLSRIKEIADRLRLPEWWVQSVIIEYFPCREYLVGKDAWHFNFDIVREESIENITSKKVIVSGEITLFHNIRQEDFGPRIMSALVGEPMVPYQAEVVPEGLVNEYHVVFSLNPIDAWDPKLAFNDRAIIFDDGRFYQWAIAEFYPIEGKHYGWWKSRLFDLEELRIINEQIQEIRNAWAHGVLKDLQGPRDQLHELYDKLEQAREPIRQKILEYHNSKKAQYAKAEPSDYLPSLATLFDSVSVSEGQYKVRTYLEPLLYRAALRQLKLAKEAYEKRKTSTRPSTIIPDEIEASAVSIVCSHACAEAYINSVLEDHCKTYTKTMSRMNIVGKWFFTPYLLGSGDCFNPKTPPFSDFLQLNGWRNDIAHFRHMWRDVSRVEGITGKAGKSFAICNSINAQRAVDTVQSMIRCLSSKTRVPEPRWLYPGVNWLKDVP